MIIRGYACPYDSVAIVDGSVQETIAPGAIRLIAGHIRLLYGDHGGRPMAWTGDNSLKLWSDRTGVAFQASLGPERHARSMYDAICRGAFDGCSVLMRIERADEQIVDGVLHRRVLRASIDHVAIGNGVCYRETACWPAGAALDELPPRVWPFVLAWDRGYQSSARAQSQHRGRNQSAATRPPASAFARRADHLRCPPSVIEVLARAGRA
jgi:hypothetical protein